MTREALAKQLHSIFCEIFDNESIEISNETSPADIEDWDSVAHITLVDVIEKSFQIRFSISDIVCMHSVGDIIESIAEKLK